MDQAYKGESFPVRVRFEDDRDPDRVPDSVPYTVSCGGEVQGTGLMEQDPDGDGHDWRFRFSPTVSGMHDIWTECRMGMDKWQHHFRIDVQDGRP